MTQALPNTPLLGPLSDPHIVSTSIHEDSALCRLQSGAALTAWNWFGTRCGPVQHNWKSIHQCEVLISHEGLPLWEHTQHCYSRQHLLRNGSGTFSCLFTRLFFSASLSGAQSTNIHVMSASLPSLINYSTRLWAAFQTWIRYLANNFPQLSGREEGGDLPY